ncbi:MAG: InlB B-repeat-containing protein [Kiritimatiellae bacterium]|nr:InlB B-repeat-containing protein [Kiritimatiellia bacterium]
MWHDYVAGTDPTDINSTFKAKIEMQDGKPVVSWEPNLNSVGEERVYTVHGKETLSDIWHSPITALDHFFKVDVAMPREGTVTFNVGGGSSVSPVSIRVGQKIGELPTPTRDGYKFLGWFTAAEGGNAVTSETLVTADMTVYARWEPFDGHDKVQLWEGGPYWATTNIGAEKPEDYGYYFWWGDTVGYKRENNKWVASDGSNSNFSFSSITTCNKNVAILQSEGWITPEGVLAPEHDAAHTHWGGDWRMPTKQEFDDLNNKCDWTWTTMNGVNGYMVRGKDDFASASVFLPCAGYCDETSLYNAGSFGLYWSSVPHSDDNYGAWYLFFNSGDHSKGCFSRFLGHSVRPLQGFTK